MLIEVTQADIDAGERRDQLCCPVALALARQTGRTCQVAATRIQLPDGGRVVTPDEVFFFVMDFDEGRPVEPFRFELPL